MVTTKILASRGSGDTRQDQRELDTDSQDQPLFAQPQDQTTAIGGPANEIQIDRISVL